MRWLIYDHAKISLQLSSIRFDKMGSLDFDATGGIEVGPFIPAHPFNSPVAPHFGGPFRNVRDCFLWQIDNVLSLIKRGQIARRSPLLAYLAHLEARSLVAGCAEMAETQSAFYVQHPDSGGRNVMALDGRITALVDWEW